MLKQEVLISENLGCNRTDGRQWTCGRKVIDGKKLCETHHLQGLHRQNRQKVPESLKIRRRQKDTPNHLIRANKSKKMKRDKARKLRKNDLKLDLIKTFLQRESKRRKKCEFVENSDGELTRDLPNGIMAISSVQSNPRRVGSYCEIKLGLNICSFTRRCFRSKNIEPLPVGSIQIVPFAKNIANLRRFRTKNCHWCQKSLLQNFVKCSSCQKDVFCHQCIKERCLDKEEIRLACPVCLQACSCKSCLLNQSADVECKDFSSDKNKVHRILHFHYLICTLLPVLEQINQDQRIELEIEAKIKGKTPSQVQIQQAIIGCNKKCTCDICKCSIVDFHRSCSTCSYNICLSCCQELCLRRSKLHVYKCPDKKKCFGRTQAYNGDNASSTTEFGGCGDGVLELKSIFPFCWTNDLETSAGEIIYSYDFQETLDPSSSCSLCNALEHETAGNKQVQKAATREDPIDNFLYCPSVQDIFHNDSEHFRKHWAKGHPVIIRNLIPSGSNLVWDPIAMFCTYLEKSISGSVNIDEAIISNNCLDWCEVEIGSRESFWGSLGGHTYANTDHEMLKMKGWVSSNLFQQYFPSQYAEVIRSLPLQEYLNPKAGLLNLNAHLLSETPGIDGGPSIYISYGESDEPLQSNFLTKLRYDSHDVVNILARASDVPISSEQVSIIKKLVKKYKARYQRDSIKSSSDQKIESKMNEKTILPNGKVPELKIETLLHAEKYDSESSIFGGKTSQNCPENEGPNRDHTGDSNCFEKTLVTNTCGAQWDVFRREDVPKLIEYLRIHSDEFRHHYVIPKHVVHPILDQIFFLNVTDKLRLKKEFNIEPWTFEQHIGEAVIIPAGCPYQIKNLKCCVNVVLDFVSPENVAKCIQLTDEFRLLPKDHKARKNQLEVKRMAIHSVSRAIKEIQKISSAE